MHDVCRACRLWDITMIPQHNIDARWKLSLSLHSLSNQKIPYDSSSLPFQHDTILTLCFRSRLKILGGCRLPSFSSGLFIAWQLSCSFNKLSSSPNYLMPEISWFCGCNLQRTHYWLTTISIYNPLRYWDGRTKWIVNLFLLWLI